MREREEIQAEIDQILVKATVAIEQGRTDLVRYYRSKLEILLWLLQPDLSDTAVQQVIDKLITGQTTDQSGDK